MCSTAHARKSGLIPTLLVALAAIVVSAGLTTPVAAQLVNPGFDGGPVGPVGNFGTVVGPPFQAGFWGAEDASIEAATPCYDPQSSPYFLQLNVTSDAYSQAWQAVDVSSGATCVH